MLISDTIVVDNDIYLKQLECKDAEIFFNLTLKNVGHLIQWFKWASELSLDKTKKFVNYSYEKNKNKSGCDLGIYYKNNLVGV
ncbi:MAG: hypothetical protein LBC92_05590, partial [Rickettsiales bacterium]|nr:hypothetical protein [Rickettsiales bacterium]